MNSIIDDTTALLDSMGLDVEIAEMQQGFVGIFVELPDYSSVYFVWSSMVGGDYRFRLARFLEPDKPLTNFIAQNIPLAIEKTRSLIEQSKLI